MQELYLPLDAVLVAGTQRVFNGKAEPVSRRSVESQPALFGSTTISKRLTIIIWKIRTITLQHTSESHLWNCLTMRQRLPACKGRELYGESLAGPRSAPCGCGGLRAQCTGVQKSVSTVTQTKKQTNKNTRYQAYNICILLIMLE